MTKRPLALLSAAVFALTLSACGDDGSSDGSSSDGNSSASSEESASDSPAPKEGGDAEESDDAATGEDYRDLTKTLFDVDGPQEGFKSVQQFNRLANFPDGVEVAIFNESKKVVCIQDANRDIAVNLLASGEGSLSLIDGMCQGGDEQAALTVGDDPDDVVASGDEDLAEPVRQYLLESAEG